MNNFSSCRNILTAVENVNIDLPPVGFCIEFLLGSKYEKHAKQGKVGVIYKS